MASNTCIDWHELDNKGFFSFDICSHAEIDVLKELYEATQSQETRYGMYVSLNSGESININQTNIKIYQILAKSISKLFPNYEYFIGHFAIKKKNTADCFDLHRDWNVVDESRHNSIGIWIPLSKSMPENGGMCFIPQSHHFNNAPRSGSLGIPFIKIEPELYPYLVKPQLNEGEAVCFYKNLFHGSFPNHTDNDRIAVLVNLVPKNVPTEYIHWNEHTNKIQVYSMTADELINSLPSLEKGDSPTTELKRETPAPLSFKKQGYIPKDEILTWIKSNQQTIANKSSIQLHNPISELQEKGYTILKSSFEWQELLNNSIVVDKLDSVSKSGTFYYSLLNNDRKTNELLSSLIVQRFKHPLSWLFPNYRFLAGSFLAKQARDYSELNLHQDWCNTDESKFASITAWTPLIDTDEKCGGMFFLDGSHKYFNNLRSYGYETARFSLTEIGKENITSITVKKGDILLFNPAVWHGSFPNTHDNVRIAFTCIILPENAPFYYFHKYSDEFALKCNVPDNMLECYLSDIVKGKQVDIYDTGILVHYNHPKITHSDLIKKHTSSPHAQK